MTDRGPANPVAVLRYWSGDGVRGARLYMWCPGCDDLHSAEIERPDTRWEWDCNLEAPTLSPSLKVTGVQWDESSGFHKPNHHVGAGQETCCHSFVKAGRWEFLGDCTHALAGQTVPLPPVPNWIMTGATDD